ncbi:MAG: hypothetical protein IT473_05890, partial [Lysobacter sp.]|nr:hypothetical protein [Lysobacter sp.]
MAHRLSPSVGGGADSSPINPNDEASDSSRGAGFGCGANGEGGVGFGGMGFGSMGFGGGGLAGGEDAAAAARACAAAVARARTDKGCGADSSPINPIGGSGSLRVGSGRVGAGGLGACGAGFGGDDGRRPTGAAGADAV